MCGSVEEIILHSIYMSNSRSRDRSLDRINWVNNVQYILFEEDWQETGMWERWVQKKAPEGFPWGLRERRVKRKH